MADDINNELNEYTPEVPEGLFEPKEEIEEAAKDAAEEVSETVEAADDKAAKKAEKASKAAEEAKRREAEKAQKAQDKADAKAAKKAEKKRLKREKQQALIDACPRIYRPVSTSAFFWLGVISTIIPGVSFILTILLSLIPRNRNIKHFERAILILHIIWIIIAVILVAIFYLALDTQTQTDFINSVTKIVSAFSFS